MIYNSYLVSKIGILKISATENNIIGIQLVNEKSDKESTNLIIEKCKKELQEYFLNTRKKFDIPISFNGTNFQNRVWQELLKIPYGKTVSYSDIALQIGNLKAVRAVGNAIHKNPLLIIIPCHRVIGKNKKLVGFAYGLDIKKQLLILEKDI